MKFLLSVRGPAVIRITGISLFLFVFAMIGFGDMDHSMLLQNYEGSKTCTQCHDGKVEDVMDSVHYTWRTENDKIAFPGGGSIVFAHW